MSDSFTNCVKHLNLVSSLPIKTRKVVLTKLACNSCYYKSIKEIAKNVVKKNIKPTKVSKIKKHWKI